MSGGYPRVLDEAHNSGGVISCTCGRVHKVGVRSVAVASGAIRGIGHAVSECIGTGSRILVAADAMTYEAAGHAVEALLVEAGHTVSAHVWRTGETPLAPDADAVLELLGAVQPHETDALVAVGGGTVHDLTKFVAAKTGLPLVSVPTAASVDAYLSASSALLSRGLKLSVAGMRPPVAVLADIAVIEQAPPALIGSAVADQFSKVISCADWVLANHLRGTAICPRAWELNQGVLAAVSAQVEVISSSTADGYSILMGALIDSGLGMLIYGSSLPASGSEHLIAHMLESIAAAEGLPPTAHGHRVGVAALIASELYSRLVDVETTELDRYARRIPGVGTRLRNGSLVPPAIVASIRHGDGQATAAHTLTPPDLASTWPVLRERLRSTLAEHQASLRDVIERAGAPTSYSDLGFTAAHMELAVRAAPYLRDRYGVLHLLRDLDLLDDWLPQALAAVGPAPR
jgi:glycerol-1-phosphate dehydrogenase [NAD(P)+]